MQVKRQTWLWLSWAAGWLVAGWCAPLIGAEAVKAPMSHVRSPNRIIFLVGGKPVFSKTLDHRLRFTALSMGLQPSPALFEKLRPSVIQAMVTEIIQKTVAEKYDLKVSEDDVKRAFHDFEKGNGLASGALAKMMASQGIPEETLFMTLRSDLLWGEYIRARYLSEVRISDAEVDEAMARAEEDQSKVRYHLAEIVLCVDPEHPESQVKAQADQITTWLQQGAPFALVAQQLSQGPTASRGGHLGWVLEDTLTSEENTVLGQLDKNMLSRPIETTIAGSKAYKIYAVIDKKGSDAPAEAPDRQKIMTSLKVKALDRLASADMMRWRRQTPVEIR